MHKKFGEDRTCSSTDVLADRQTHTDTDRHTVITILRHPTGSEVTSFTCTRTQSLYPTGQR